MPCPRRLDPASRRGRWGRSGSLGTLEPAPKRLLKCFSNFVFSAPVANFRIHLTVVQCQGSRMEKLNSMHLSNAWQDLNSPATDAERASELLSVIDGSPVSK